MPLYIAEFQSGPDSMIQFISHFLYFFERLNSRIIFGIEGIKIYPNGSIWDLLQTNVSQRNGHFRDFSRFSEFYAPHMAWTIKTIISKVTFTSIYRFKHVTSTIKGELYHFKESNIIAWISDHQNFLDSDDQNSIWLDVRRKCIDFPAEANFGHPHLIRRLFSWMSRKSKFQKKAAAVFLLKALYQFTNVVAYLVSEIR